MYYDLRKRGDRLEFHTGDNSSDVANGESLNRAINLTAEAIDPVYVAEWVNACMYEIDMHSMKLARTVY